VVSNAVVIIIIIIIIINDDIFLTINLVHQNPFSNF